MTQSFGRRNAGTTPARQIRTQHNFQHASSTSSPASHAIEQTHGIAEEKEGGKLKSFAIACVTGLTFSIILMGLYTGTNAPGFFGSRFFLNIVSGMALLTMAPIILIASRILADVMRLLKVPRGYSDIMIGALVGSAMFLPSLTSSDPIDWRALAFVMGGAIGGFTYWRSRGYPGLRRNHTKSAEIGFGALKRIKLD